MTSRTPGGSTNDSLSEREREIFRLIAEGPATKEIAVIRSISPATVETATRILHKLDAHNTAELAKQE